MRVMKLNRNLLSLATTAVLSAALGFGLVACDNAAQTAVSLAPVEIDRSTSCELDGMLLSDYPGPKAQVHYAGQAQPSFFCDTVELFNTLLAGEQVRAPKAAVYVLGSKRHGSMGPTIASFAQEADATKFAAEYGGKVLRFDAITVDMVDLSGAALHDTRM